MDLLINANEEDRARAIRQMPVSDLLKSDADFESWAHRNQLPPSSEGWRTWLMRAGRGFGKTRAGAEWIFRLGEGKPGARIALVGGTMAEARLVMVEGVSGLLGVARRYGRKLEWEPGLGRLTWPNGSQAQIFSGDNADGLRGPEHDFAWCDELAKWRQAQEAWDNLQFGLRRGSRPRALITTTPRPLRLLETIEAQATTVTTQGRTSENINLDEKVIALLTATYAGTRLGRQELDGEMLGDVEGTLWPRDVIEDARVAAITPEASGVLPFDRIVVGVDPPAGAGAGSDACGIVVAGSAGGNLYVLEDATVQGLSPEGWSSRVAAAAERWGAGLVVAEANNGGAMVESVLKTADVPVRVRLVHATRGKSARAEPIAFQFETPM